MPKPKKGETEKDFVKRCIPELMHEGRPQNQSIAICFSIYSKKGTEEVSPYPKNKSTKNGIKSKTESFYFTFFLIFIFAFSYLHL